MTMFELTVERTFCAAHAIYINGELEPVHGHNWNVRLTVQSDHLDDNGLVCDFHALERALEGVIGSWNNQYLNHIPPFDRTNPTAELVAKQIAVAVQPQLPADVRLTAVSVTEAPGCIATWRA